MGKIDERLRRDLERVAEPADPAGVAGRVLRRADLRRSRRRAQTAFLTLVVVAGTIGGVLALARVFRTDGGTFPGVFPVPIELHANGRIAFAFSGRNGMHLETIQPDGERPGRRPDPRRAPLAARLVTGRQPAGRRDLPPEWWPPRHLGHGCGRGERRANRRGGQREPT